MHALAESLPIWSVAPFVGLLLSLALAPLFAPSWWGSHHKKALLGFSLPVVLFFLFEDPSALVHAAQEYIAFIVLLGSLFVITGGILVQGNFPPTPWVNALFLAGGAVIANLIGTTGASVLLLRPILRANCHRARSGHVFVFFIFLVSNIGGALTPLGDPPLFLGFLRGVPFTWTLRLLPEWLFTVGCVLAVFLAFDLHFWRQERRHPRESLELSIRGRRNFLYLLGVLVSVFLPNPYREIGMIGMALMSFRTTDPSIHAENRFSWAPIEEVAVVFAGIFATMLPALLLLEARGAQAGLHHPWQFFWVTGGLSSFLDNAPTYLTFFSALQGLGLPADVAGVPAEHLKAISLGAVFMGANSYIGNGPNFMVKSIVEEHGIPMPSFFGYLVYSTAVLVPIFIALTLIFLL